MRVLIVCPSCKRETDTIWLRAPATQGTCKTCYEERMQRTQEQCLASEATQRRA